MSPALKVTREGKEHVWVGLTLLEPPCGEFSAELFLL